jgi:tRNA (guanosine-2'-O-)-methyltransferase
MLTEVKEEQQLVTNYLGEFISEKRKNLIEKVLSARTRYVTIVLEDIFQSQNMSAVIRTCECMGLQDVHIIEQSSSYSVNKKVIKGANKWMDLIQYKNKNSNSAEECFQRLKKDGYTIYVADPAPDGYAIEDLPLNSKIALVMGNELNGISSYATQHADGKVNIPMHGFTESLNVSVSAAICLNTLIPKLRKSSIAWQLTKDEVDFIRLKWYRSSVRRSDLLEREYLRSIR